MVGFPPPLIRILKGLRIRRLIAKIIFIIIISIASYKCVVCLCEPIKFGQWESRDASGDNPLNIIVIMVIISTL